MRVADDIDLKCITTTVVLFETKQNITKGVIIIIKEWRHVTSSLKANNYYNYYEDD